MRSWLVHPVWAGRSTAAVPGVAVHPAACCPTERRLGVCRRCPLACWRHCDALQSAWVASIESQTCNLPLQRQFWGPVSRSPFLWPPSAAHSSLRARRGPLGIRKLDLALPRRPSALLCLLAKVRPIRAGPQRAAAGRSRWGDGLMLPEARAAARRRPGAGAAAEGVSPAPARMPGGDAAPPCSREGRQGRHGPPQGLINTAGSLVEPPSPPTSLLVPALLQPPCGGLVSLPSIGKCGQHVGSSSQVRPISPRPLTGPLSCFTGP